MAFKGGKFHQPGKEKPAAKPEHGKPEHEKSAAPQQEHDGAMEHSSKTHGTEPHPSTGVHAVHMHHHGTHVMNHVHHDGGHIESVQHPDLNAAHDHAQQMLPPSEEQGEVQPEAMSPEEGPMSNLRGLGE